MTNIAILAPGSIARSMAKTLRGMKAHLLDLLEANVPGVHVNGPRPLDEASAPHVLSVSIEGVRGEVMRNALEGADVLVSTGSACASHKQKVSQTLKSMGVSSELADGTIRISLGLNNTMEEMDITAAHMAKMAALLAKYRRR